MCAPLLAAASVLLRPFFPRHATPLKLLRAAVPPIGRPAGSVRRRSGPVPLFSQGGDMLILNRRCGDRVVIGDVVLAVEQIDGQRVRLGLTPRSVRRIELRADDPGGGGSLVPEVEITERGG